MNEILIIGAGGHGRVALSVLQTIADYRIVGIIDDEYHDQQETILGHPVIGGLELLPRMQNENTHCFVAIGDNDKREEYFTMVRDHGYILPTIVSPHSYVDVTVATGTGNLICPYAYLGCEVVLGHNNVINTHAVIEHETQIGNATHVAPNATVLGRCRVGDNVLIGASAVVLPKLRIANGVTVGANATVTNHLTAGTYVGTPAKNI